MKHDPTKIDTILTPEMSLRAYTLGLFPMARSRADTQIFWLDPDKRGIIIPKSFHIPKKLQKTLRQNIYTVRYNQQFQNVIHACAEETPKRQDTWLNSEIINLHVQLHSKGYAHSVECYRDDGLVGGLYGIALGAAFFGESMFSTATDASKVALCHLVARLKQRHFCLLDTQFMTPHLRQFGAEEVTRKIYRMLLQDALAVPKRIFA